MACTGPPCTVRLKFDPQTTTGERTNTAAHSSRRFAVYFLYTVLRSLATYIIVAIILGEKYTRCTNLVGVGCLQATTGMAICTSYKQCHWASWHIMSSNYHSAIYIEIQSYVVAITRPKSGTKAGGRRRVKSGHSRSSAVVERRR